MKQQTPSRSILVVDDDAIICNMMIEILSAELHLVRTARNGREALELLRSDEHFLVFLDLTMPEINGREVCMILNQEPEVRSRHIIVLMSALDSLAEVASLNIDATMPKPFTVDDVFDIIGTYIQ